MKWEQFFNTSDIKVLLYLQEKEQARYSHLYKLIPVRSVLSRSLRDLQKRKLIERVVVHAQPIQTKYHLTSKGHEVVELLARLQKLIT